MKLTMKNIGVIRDAEIELDGITVLAGLNGTGKSTVCKSLYGIMTAYADLSRRVANARIESLQDLIAFRLFSYLYEDVPLFDKAKSAFCADLANKRRPVPERYEEWVDLFPELQAGRNSEVEKEIFPKFLEKLRTAVNRPDAEYIQYLASGTLRAVFDGQINTIDSPAPGEIVLTTTRETRRVSVAGNKVTECAGKEFNAPAPIYLDTRHVLSNANKTQTEKPYDSDWYGLLRNSNPPRSMEEHESRERVQDWIFSIIHGKLILTAFGDLVFKDERFSEPLSLGNIASGNQTFAVLQRLVEQGTLRPGGVLILDEPESNQNPEWQLKLAETLILLRKELGVRIFMNTHSPYFLRGIEVYADEHDLSGCCHYYQTQPVDDAENMFRVRNVDGNTDVIYRAFYMPFEDL